MNFRASFVFFFLIGISTTLFGHNLQDEIISDSILYMERIVAEAPEIIKQHRDGKYYLEENRIYSMGDGGYLLLADEKNIPLHSSLLFADNDGPYFSLSREMIANKLFKNVCYNCRYEWAGGVFTFRCPKCYSTDIGNVPNR